MKFGSRGQLLAALSAVFALSFGLLSLATLQLTRRNAELAQARLARVYGESLLRGFSRGPTQPLIATLQQLRREEHLLFATLTDDGIEHHIGEVIIEAPVEQLSFGRRTLKLAVTPTKGPRTAALERLLLFYVTLTGLSVMGLAYVLLTWTIVRPLRAATYSAEALSRGDLHARMPLRGAAEVVRLSKAFNVMADALRKERQELEERVRDLEGMTVELRETRNQVIHAEKLASVGRLSAGVAHEIGNPLAAVLGMLELLQEESLDEAEQREFLARIKRETERINGIISDLLSYARRDSSVEVQEGTANVREVANDVLGLLQGQLGARKITLHVEVPQGLIVRGGAPQLTQVILNLVLNGSDATGDGGHLQLRAERSSNGVLVHVEDDGPGIDSAMADHLFEPFTTSKRPGQGTGLGLFVSHALIERMGGQIRAEDRAEGGARFILTLQDGAADTVG